MSSTPLNSNAVTAPSLSAPPYLFAAWNIFGEHPNAEELLLVIFCDTVMTIDAIGQSPLMNIYDFANE